MKAFVFRGDDSRDSCGDRRKRGVEGKFFYVTFDLVLNEKLGHSIERYTKELAMIKLPFNWNPFFVLTFLFFFLFQECNKNTCLDRFYRRKDVGHDRFALFNIGCRANLPFVSIQRSRFSSVRFKWNFGWLGMFGDLD